MSKISIILLVTLSVGEIYAPYQIRRQYSNGLRPALNSQRSLNGRSLLPTTSHLLLQDKSEMNPQKSMEEGIAQLISSNGPASYGPASYGPASPLNGSFGGRETRPKVWLEGDVIRVRYNGRMPTKEEQYQILIEDDPDIPDEIGSYRRDEYKPLAANTVTTGYIKPKPEINNGEIKKSLPCGGEVTAHISGVTDFHIINRLTKEMRNAITNLCRKEQDPDPRATDGTVTETEVRYY